VVAVGVPLEDVPENIGTGQRPELRPHSGSSIQRDDIMDTVVEISRQIVSEDQAAP
jgi:hypothetical protein